MNDKDKLMIPLNIFNNQKKDVYVTFNCTMRDGEWDLSCPSNHRVIPSSVERTYITLKVSYMSCIDYRESNLLSFQKSKKDLEGLDDSIERLCLSIHH